MHPKKLKSIEELKAGMFVVDQFGDHLKVVLVFSVGESSLSDTSGSMLKYVGLDRMGRIMTRYLFELELEDFRVLE